MWEIIRANQRKSALLVVFMAALLFGAGYAAGELLLGPGAGSAGLFLAFVLWIVLTLVAWFQGKQIFMSVSGARRLKQEDHPRLFNVVEEMKIASQVPAMPEVYLIDDPAPNAFAAGRKPEASAVAVTTGLLNSLSRDELQGVIAHEMGHVKNRDILFMTMIGVMMGAVVMIADITLRSLFYGGGRRSSRTSDRGGGQGQLILLVLALVLMILAPILAQLIYLAASRKREYLADASAARFTRYPEGLASALEKIAAAPAKLKAANKVTAPMYIVNPLQGASVAGLFSTHPPVGTRIRILRGMAGGAGFAAYDQAYRQVTGDRAPVLPGSALAGEAGEPARTATPAAAQAPKPSPVRATMPAGAVITAAAGGKAAAAAAASGAVLPAILTVAAAGQVSAPSTASPAAAAAGPQGQAAGEAMSPAAAGEPIPATLATAASLEGEPAGRPARIRETTDALWHARGYRFLACPCGATLKVPPEYRRPSLPCLRCGRSHSLATPAA